MHKRVARRLRRQHRPASTVWRPGQGTAAIESATKVRHIKGSWKVAKMLLDKLYERGEIKQLNRKADVFADLLSKSLKHEFYVKWLNFPWLAANNCSDAEADLIEKS
ncbi:hypothetical protein GOBAR_DD02664 [Gossypium barbadense]|nr:hypothetical protein GOBAR_DD02664 [Gossypium barbadense]